MALACAKLPRMAPETTQSNPSRPEQGSINFTQKEIIVLQGLIDGLTWKEFDAQFDITRLVLKNSKESIASRFSPTGQIGGIYIAIAEAIKQDLLDTSNLPKEYAGQLTKLEIQFFALQYKGVKPSSVSETLGIGIYEIPTYRNRICE